MFGAPSLCRGPFCVNRCSWEGWSVNFYCHKDELLFIHEERHKRRPGKDNSAFVCVCVCMCA